MKENRANSSRRRRRRQSDIINLVLRIVCIAMILVGIIMLVKIWEDKSMRDSEDPSAGLLVTAPDKSKEIVSYNGKDYALRDDLETILVIGYDGRSDDDKEDSTDNYNQADLVFLVIADKTNGRYHTLHVNRDAMTNVKVLTDMGAMTREFTGQIALSYAYGGTEGIRCRNTVDSLSSLLGGIKIDHYVSVGMDCVPTLNDSVGGVTLEVMDDINDELKRGATVTLRGEQALTYVRAREHDAEANLHRMERQKQYLGAFRGLFADRVAADSSFALTELLKLGEHMYSDCTVEKLADIVNTVMELEGSEYLTLEGENRQGKEFVEFYPDEAALRDLTIRLFYEEID